MKKEFKKEIESPFFSSFEIGQEDLYTISIKASCKPGWRNKWWLRFKSILEDILDLHLDDEDLRVEIDEIQFRKPKAKRGLFNSPAAFSGTKTLGKTKTVVFIIYLTKGSHTIKFIPDGSPYLESIEIKKLDAPQKFIFSPNIQAEDENYYSWCSFTLVDLPLKSISITAKAGIKEGAADDDDLKILIDGDLQENPNNRHKRSYFCGFTLKGKEETFSQTFNLPKATHYIELFADKTPILKTIKLLFQREEKFEILDPPKKEEGFNPQYVMKDSAFIDSNSMSEEEIKGFLKQYGENYPNHLYRKLFEGKKASFWIKKFATEFEINPKIILTKLQAEKGLVNGDQSIDPSQEQLDYALGVGCLPNRPCDPKFKGFVTQVNSACRTFRNNFEKAEDNNFEVLVDRKPLKAINRATFSILKYSPFLSSIKLFYDVYKGFFGVQDLGGKVEISTRPNAKILSFLLAGLISLSLFFMVVKTNPITEQRNLFQNEIVSSSNEVLGIKEEIFPELPEYYFVAHLLDGYQIKLEVRTDRIKRLKPEEYWCGAPFLVDYKGEAKAEILDKNGEVVAQFELTSPSLVLEEPPNYDFYFYKLYDINGDGAKKEFVVLEYFSCNGNFLKVVKIDENEKKFVILPFQIEGELLDKVIIGPTKEYFGFSNGQLWTKSYDMFEGKFYKKIFHHNKNGVFREVRELEEKL